MEFTYAGVCTQLQGIQNSYLQDSTSSSLKYHIHTQSMSQFLHLSIFLDVEDPDQRLASNPLDDPATLSFFVD